MAGIGLTIFIAMANRWLPIGEGPPWRTPTPCALRVGLIFLEPPADPDAVSGAEDAGLEESFCEGST